MTAWKPIGLFLTLAYGLAWLIWLPLLLGPAGLRLTRFNAYLPLFVSLGSIGPFLASFLAVRYEKGMWGMPGNLLPTKRLRSWVNLLTNPALTIIAFVIIPYIICVEPGHKLISLSFLIPLLRIWPNILGGPLEEEFGWRGYLLPRLASLIGKTWATLLVGVIWASWHLPLILCHIFAGVSFWYYLPLVMALSVFASVSYFATGRSILGPIILHYVFNRCSFMLAKAFEGQPFYPNWDWNEFSLICMVAVTLLTIAVTKGRMGESRKSVNAA